MVEDTLNNGRRIGQLLASEIRGRTREPLGSLAVVDVRDADGRTDGLFAYGIDHGDERLAAVYVHENRASLAVLTGIEVALAAAERNGLDLQEDPPDSPGPGAVVDSGVAVKRVLNVLEAVVDAVDGSEGAGGAEGADGAGGAEGAEGAEGANGSPGRTE